MSLAAGANPTPNDGEHPHERLEVRPGVSAQLQHWQEAMGELRNMPAVTAATVAGDGRIEGGFP